jgi:hypothetical protein
MLLNLGWIVLGIGIAVALLAVALSRRRRDQDPDLGSVSSNWIAEQRTGQNR